MFWMLLALTGQAAELKVTITAHDGQVQESWTQAPSEPFQAQLGPVANGKKGAVTYLLVLPPSVFDIEKRGYALSLGICREWTKGRKKGRDCIEQPVVALPEAEGPGVAFGEVKDDGGKWDYRVEAAFTGEAPYSLEPNEPEAETEASEASSE